MVPPSPAPLPVAVVHASSKTQASEASSSRPDNGQPKRTSASPSRKTPSSAASLPASPKPVKPSPSASLHNVYKSHPPPRVKSASVHSPPSASVSHQRSSSQILNSLVNS